jgi:type I restriction enzyme S subunit
MNKTKCVHIGSFLEERGKKYSAEEANKLSLRRIEKIDFSGNIHFSDGKTTRTGMILIKKGDLVISGINVEKGAVAVYCGEEDVLATIHYSSYLFNENKVDIEYFKWFLKSSFFRNVVSLGTRGGIKTEIKPKHFLSFIIPLPSLDVQIKIRNKLDSIKDEIEELWRLDCKNEGYVQELRQAILQKVILGKLVPQDPNDEPASAFLKKIKFEKDKLIEEKKLKKEKILPPISSEEFPYEAPNGWSWVRLGEITTKIGSGSTPRGGKNVYTKTGIPFIRSQNVWNTGLRLDDVVHITEEINKKMEGTKVFPGDILLNITGASIGRTCIVPEEFKEGNVSQHVSIIRLISASITPFVHFFLLSSYLQKRIMDVQVGVSREGLSKKNMELFLIPIPPLSEQNRIIQKLDNLFKLCNSLEEKVKENQRYSEPLMEAVLKDALGSLVTLN